MAKKKIIDLDFMKSVFTDAIDYKKKLTLNSAFESVPGWDSLGHMKIISTIEKKLKVNFEIDEIIDVNTVRKLIVLAQKKIK